MEQLLTGANQLVNNLLGIKEKQLWLAGTLSPRARKEIESRGWKVRDRAETQVFNWVETYPDYKKPEERVPAGLVTLEFKIRRPRGRSESRQFSNQPMRALPESPYRLTYDPASDQLKGIYYQPAEKQRFEVALCE